MGNKSEGGWSSVAYTVYQLKPDYVLSSSGSFYGPERVQRWS